MFLAVFKKLQKKYPEQQKEIAQDIFGLVPQRKRFYRFTNKVMQ